ncbi:redoxin domain-containing protein [uncultured Trichococcus sp.]|uniref:redoxin domain-containing protein n=1 Tax=uncultured Trichococcus sp. TaxID=189665 RepID=UPI0029C6E6AD|nr:redoxin domain-containing protein [uncultured Trichococcus sp.]
MKLIEGTEIDDFLFLKNGNSESFRSQLKRDFTAVIFLRHLGCGMSQLDMLKYRDAHQFLKEQRIEIMMVIQGTEAAVSERTAKMNIPFTVIADPEQTLYQHFDIPSSESMRDLVYGVSEEKLLEFEYYGIECQRFEGNELQLQSTIVVDRRGQVVLSHYSENISDVPSPSELYQILQTVPVGS